MAALTITLNESMLARVDEAAAERETTRERIAEMALATFLLEANRQRDDLGLLLDWQLADIEAGLAAAERGEFASEEDVKAIFDRYRS